MTVLLFFVVVGLFGWMGRLFFLMLRLLGVLRLLLGVLRLFILVVRLHKKSPGNYLPGLTFIPSASFDLILVHTSREIAIAPG